MCLKTVFKSSFVISVISINPGLVRGITHTTLICTQKAKTKLQLQLAWFSSSSSGPLSFMRGSSLGKRCKFSPCMLEMVFYIVLFGLIGLLGCQGLLLLVTGLFYNNYYSDL